MKYTTPQYCALAAAIAIFTTASAGLYNKIRTDEREQFLKRTDSAQVDCSVRADQSIDLYKTKAISSPRVFENIVYPFDHKPTTDFAITIDYTGEHSQATCLYKYDGTLITFHWK